MACWWHCCSPCRRCRMMATRISSSSPSTSTTMKWWLYWHPYYEIPFVLLLLLLKAGIRKILSRHGVSRARRRSTYKLARSDEEQQHQQQCFLKLQKSEAKLKSMGGELHGRLTVTRCQIRQALTPVERLSHQSCFSSNFFQSQRALVSKIKIPFFCASDQGRRTLLVSSLWLASSKLLLCCCKTTIWSDCVYYLFYGICFDWRMHLCL